MNFYRRTYYHIRRRVRPHTQGMHWSWCRSHPDNYVLLQHQKILIETSNQNFFASALGLAAHKHQHPYLWRVQKPRWSQMQSSLKCKYVREANKDSGPNGQGNGGSSGIIGAGLIEILLGAMPSRTKSAAVKWYGRQYNNLRFYDVFRDANFKINENRCGLRWSCKQSSGLCKQRTLLTSPDWCVRKTTRASEQIE